MRFPNPMHTTDRCVTISGQLARYADIVQMPYSGRAILHPATKTVDLIVHTMVEGYAEPPTEKQYDYIDLQSICNALGVNSIKWDAMSSTVVPIDVVGGRIPQSYLGRSGLCLQEVNGMANIARSYLDNLGEVGAWPLNSPLFSSVGMAYAIIVPGATYN